MSTHKIVMTERINNSDEQFYPKTSADIVLYDDNTTVYDKISTLESGKANTSHTHSTATTSANGFMSSTDKSKLDNIETLTVSEIETIFDVSSSVSPLTGNSANYFLRGDKTWQIPNAVANITRSGLTYTATKMDGTSFTFNIPTGTASNTVSAGNHTHSAMSAASSSTAGTAGFVPAPQAGSQNYFLRGDATWAIPAGITATSLYDAPTGTDVSSSTSLTGITSISGYAYVEIYYSQGNGIACAKGIVNASGGITPNAIQLTKYVYSSNDDSLSIYTAAVSINGTTLTLEGSETFKIYRIVGYK